MSKLSSGAPRCGSEREEAKPADPRKAAIKKAKALTIALGFHAGRRLIARTVRNADAPNVVAFPIRLTVRPYVPDWAPPPPEIVPSLPIAWPVKRAPMVIIEPRAPVPEQTRPITSGPPGEQMVLAFPGRSEPKDARRVFDNVRERPRERASVTERDKA